MAKVAIQGGVKNYLGNQKTVGNVPLKWQSGPDAPDTELAYITKAEKNLLLKKDLHGSLKNGPNTGPEGIMSLDSQGDKGDTGYGNSYGDRDVGDTSPEVGDKGGGYTEKGDPGHQANINKIKKAAREEEARQQARTDDSKKRQEEESKQRAKAFAAAQAKKLDAEKAQTIYGYQPNKYIDYVPYLGALRKTVGTPFTKKGKTLTAQKRMEYINTLPAQQRRAMIERLGLAEDEEYDELDEYNLATQTYTDPKTGKVTGPAGVFNTEDVDPNFGRYDNVGTDYTLTGDPLSYQGETPLYGMDAYDIINYDGEFLKNYGRDLNNTGGGGGGGGGSQTILPYLYNVQQPEEEKVPEDTGPKYRFGNKQDVIFDDYGTAGYRTTRAAEGGIMGTRARRAMGGIMNRIDQRQGFFLGGIGKAIGKIGKAAGKVLSSDIGKMAIAGAAFYYGGGGASVFKDGGLKAMGSNFMSRSNPLLFNKAKELSLGKLFGVSTVLPYIFGDAKPNKTSFSDRGGHLIDPLTGKESIDGGPSMRENIELAKLEAGDDPDKLAAIDAKYNNMLNLKYHANLPDATPFEGYGKPFYRTTRAATGGRIGKAEGGLLDLGGMEKDYRAEGGFVPIGEYEKKDDVPARLSVNEFVMTADAVRGAGQGDIDKGAEIMENMMKNLENGGTVSEESQGNKGAQQMFETSERLGAII
jgi:hypothetical protein